MMDSTGAFGWGPGFGFIFMILFWGLVIFGLVAIVKGITRSLNNPGTSTPKTAQQILAERYARGEIDREEFEQKKHDLE